MNKLSVISLVLYMLCSLNVNATETECFWGGKTPWQKMTTVLYNHGVDTVGMGVTTLIRADILNEAVPNLDKTFGVKSDYGSTYGDHELIGNVLCQYMQLMYTKQNEKHMYYRTRYSTDENDYAKFILSYPDSRYADEMQWKMNCMKAYWSWFEAMTEEACRLAHLHSKTVDNNVHEGFVSEYRDVVQYIQTVEDWEQLMLARAADGYSDCDAFTQFSRDHAGHLTGYNFFINDSIHNCEHNNAWSEARAANTIDGYRIYVIRFPEGEYAAWAKRFIADHEDWLDAREADNHAAYAAYCEKHPSGDSINVARELMRRMEEADWKRVKDSKNWLDFQALLDRYPDGYYSDSASESIQSLFATPESNMNDVFCGIGSCSVTDTGVVCIANNSLFQSALRFTFIRRGRTVLQKNLQSGESYQFKIKNGTYHVVIDNPGNIHFKGLSDPYATHGDMTVTSKVYRFDYYSYPVNSTTKSLDNSTLMRIYGDRKAEKRALAAMYSYLEKNKITVWMNEYVCIKDRIFIWYTNGYNTNQYKDVFLTGDALKENKKVFANEYRDIMLGLEAYSIPLRVVMFNSATQTNDVFEYSAAELKQLKTKKIKK